MTSNAADALSLPHDRQLTVYADRWQQQNPGTRTEALRTHTITPIHSSRQVLIQVDVRERPKTGSGSDALTVAAFTQQNPG